MTFRRSGCRAGRIAICGNCCGIVTEWYILMTRQDVLQGFAQIAQPMEPIRDLHRAPWRAASGVGPGTITADHFRLDIAQTLAICRSSRFDIAQLHAICRSSPFNGRGYAAGDRTGARHGPIVRLHGQALLPSPGAARLARAASQGSERGERTRTDQSSGRFCPVQELVYPAPSNLEPIVASLWRLARD